MKPYEQSKYQVSRMPQRATKDRIVGLICAVIALVALCFFGGDPIDAASPAQVIASK